MQEELQKIYDSEINVRIESFWDGGWQIALGDELNGFIKHDRSIRKVDDILPTLQTMIKEHYPGSVYARSLD